MGLTSTTSRQSNYTGDGAHSTYAYTFKIFSDSDLQVTVRDTSDPGVETPLTLTTHYTVTGAGSSSGGTIVLVNGAFDWIDSGSLKTDYVLSIRRVRQIKQQTDIRNQGPYFPESVEDEFDKQTMLHQQHQDEIDRSVKLSETYPASSVSPTLPPPSAGKAFRWNSGATALEAYDPTSAPSAVFPASNGVAVYTGSNTLIARSVAAGSGMSVSNGDGQSGNPTVAFSPTGLTAVTPAINDYLSIADTSDSNNPKKVLVSDVIYADEMTAFSEILNASLSASVGSNALTIALKTKGGSDASATSPIKIPFRNATDATGTYLVRSVTAALSATVSSGSTLGLSDGSIAQYVWVYALDNAGTVELAFSGSRLFDDLSVQATTAEGGAGAADSRYTLYSTTARTGVPIRLLGRFKFSLATAGTWNEVPDEISNITNLQRVDRSEVILNSGNGFGSTNTKIRRFTNAEKNVGSAITYADSAGNGASLTINEEGEYYVSFTDSRSDGTCVAGISVNSSELTTSILSITASARLACSAAPTGMGCHTSTLIRLFPGYIIRPHCSGLENDTTAALSRFQIVKVKD